MLHSHPPMTETKGAFFSRVWGFLHDVELVSTQTQNIGVHGLVPKIS